jgi:Glycosyltransferase family 87
MSARRPPLWLAAAAVTSGCADVYAVASWIQLSLFRPVHEDTRMVYVAAEAGVRYGWSTIYDMGTLSSLSALFPAGEREISSRLTYDFPPLLAWMFAPLTAFPEPVAQAVWAALSLAAFVLAWLIAAPYRGLGKLTLLLLALGLSPVLQSFWLGQPTMVLIALMAAAWWLCVNERPLAAGAALALATFLKPQAVVLIPVALLVGGRYRVVWSWVAGCAVLGIATVISLGPSGLMSWWHTLALVESSQVSANYTLANLLGFGPLTYALWLLQGSTALLVAWWRRRELEIVFAAGLLGSAATAFHFHDHDYSNLVLAAWLVLRTSPPMWHRLWLLIGILPMQVMSYGQDAVQPIVDIATKAPQLLWDSIWLGMLLICSYPASRAWLKRHDEHLRRTALQAHESG